MTGHTRMLQITDLHLTTNSHLLYDRIDTWQRLCTALSAADHFSPDAVLVTGDLYNNASLASTELAVLFDKASHELACPVIALPGNHDDSKIAAYGSCRAVSSGPEPGDHVYFIGNLRVVTLNTHGQNTLQGYLTDSQLEWLSSILQAEASLGTVLAMHHPPTPTAHEFLSSVGLAEPHRLNRVLNATDVRLIVSGHLHFPTASMLGTIPVWAGPALAYQQNAYAPHGTLQGIDAPGISVLDFFADTHAIVPVPLDVPTALFSRPLPNEPDITQLSGEHHETSH